MLSLLDAHRLLAIIGALLLVVSVLGGLLWWLDRIDAADAEAERQERDVRSWHVAQAQTQTRQATRRRPETKRPA